MGDFPEFVTSIIKEETNARWRIKKFSEIDGPESLPSPMVFEVGQIIGYPSKWKLELLSSGFNNPLNIRLSGVELPEGVKLSGMVCEARIRSRDNPQDKDFISITFTAATGPRNLTNIWNLRKSALLIDDEVVMYLKFILSVDVDASSSSCTKDITEQSLRGLSINMGHLLESGYNSDFEIHVKSSDGRGQSWIIGKVTKIKVHKSILGSRSAVFRKMLESPMTESTTGTMLIEDLSPECIKMMIKWIYTGVLDEGWKKIPEEIVTAADKYDLPCLRNFLDKYFHFACTLENALSLRRVARLYGLGAATKNVNKFIKANVEGLLD